MKKLFLFLLLIAAQAVAQDVSLGQRPAGSSGGGATFTGGTITAPILGPPSPGLVCSAPPYAFDGFATSGMDHSAGGVAICIAGVSNFSVDGGLVTAGQILRIPNGSSAFPSLHFASVTTTGLFRSGTGIGFTAGGVEIGVWNGLSLTSAVPFFAPNGSAAAPSFAFSSDADGTGTGIYRSAADQIGFSINGVRGMVLYNGALLMDSSVIQAASGSAGSPGYQFSAAGNLGLYNLSGDLALSTSGTGRMLWSTGITQVASGIQHTWSSGTIGGASDTGLARAAAGRIAVTDGGVGQGNLGISSTLYFGSGLDLQLIRVAAASLRVGDVSTGIGNIYVSVPVEANTGTKSPTLGESNELYTNTGDGDGSTVNLPDDPTVGAQYSVAVTVAQTITVSPSAGETLYLNAAACSSITSATIGGAVSIVAATGGSGALWIGTGSSWTCVP